MGQHAHVQMNAGSPPPLLGSRPPRPSDFAPPVPAAPPYPDHGAAHARPALLLAISCLLAPVVAGAALVGPRTNMEQFETGLDVGLGLLLISSFLIAVNYTLLRFGPSDDDHAVRVMSVFMTLFLAVQGVRRLIP